MTMRPWCIRTLWQRKKRECYEDFIVKYRKQQYTIFIARVPFFFFEEPADKKNRKKRGGGNWKSCCRCTWCTYHIKDALETTNKLEAGTAAKGRDNEGQMRRSDVCFGLSLFLNLILMGPQKANLVFRRSPDRANIK